MKFDIHDVLIETSSTGSFGTGEKARFIHKPSGQEIVRDTSSKISSVDKMQMMEELRKKVESTPISQLGVVSPKKKNFAEVASEDKIRSLSRLYKLANLVFNTERDVDSWFRIPHTLLRGLTPLEACKTDKGYDSVETILGSIYYGFPS